MLTLGIKIKQLREGRLISQKQLAETLNTSRSTIAKYELDAREPDINSLIKLADYFNVSIDYLLGKTEILTALDSEFNFDVTDPTIHIHITNIKKSLYTILSSRNLDLATIFKLRNDINSSLDEIFLKKYSKI